MGIYLEYAMNGLQTGILLFIISAGLTLSFGLMRVINMAHGSFYMLGAFAGLEAVLLTGSFVVGLVTAAIATALIGLAIERTLFRRLAAFSGGATLGGPCIVPSTIDSTMSARMARAATLSPVRIAPATSGRARGCSRSGVQLAQSSDPGSGD